MSRPPSPHPERSTGQEQTGDLQQLDYLPLAYSELLAIEEELAVTRLGRPRAERAADVEEADVARTFMELSALVAHVLSVYQRHYAGEAFISTAHASSSLVRHAHRLAYQPDPGLAAVGYVVLVAKEDVGGTVAAGLPLASVPLGETKAQDYETRDDVAVDAALNELIPVHADRPQVLRPGADTIRLAGVGHALAAGAPVAFAGPLWVGMRVVSAVESGDGAATIVKLDRPISTASTFQLDAGAATTTALLAHPATALRPFAANADPALFPPASVKAAAGTMLTSGYWYDVSGGVSAEDVYLSEKVDEPLVGQYVLGSTGGGLTLLRVASEAIRSVTLNRAAEEKFNVPTVKLTPKDGGFVSELESKEVKQTVTGHVSGTVTAVQLQDAAATKVKRGDLPFPAEWLTGWAAQLRLAATEPSPDPATETIELPGVLPDLRPGRPLVFTTLDESVAQVVSIRRAELLHDTTRVTWDPVTPTPANGWALADLKVLGNVARVSHGRTVQETLGGSDGVSAFQRFTLGESPVTVLPGVAGGEPALEVRVDAIRWDRVEDFADSGPDDRHYRSVTDEALVTTIVFGDGRNGAVPPSGSKNVTAVYRVGLGRAGDVGPRRLTRLKRAHPLLDRVVNVTPVGGGAEPADAEAIRSQSTRWIRTFDRAVSVSDLADLVLTMPGIARSAARWDQKRGVLLVAATATGDPPGDPDAVRAFLDARRDVAIPLELAPPDARTVRITVVLEPDPTYLVELVKDSIRAALHGEAEDAPGMFTFPARGLGQPAFLSEVYGRLEAVPGVIGVRVKRFESEDTKPGVMDVIPAGVDQWLRLSPNDLTITPLQGGTG